MRLLPSWKISLLVPPLLISDTFSRVVHCVVATFKTDYFLTSRVWIVFHLLTCTWSNKPTPTQPLVYNTVLFSVWAPAKNTKNNFCFCLSYFLLLPAQSPSHLPNLNFDFQLWTDKYPLLWLFFSSLRYIFKYSCISSPAEYIFYSLSPSMCLSLFLTNTDYCSRLL